MSPGSETPGLCPEAGFDGVLQKRPGHRQSNLVCLRYVPAGIVQRRRGTKARVLPAAGGTKSEQIVPRGEKGKGYLPGAEQAVGPLLAAGAADQPKPSAGTGAAAQHPQGAQGILGRKAQVLSSSVSTPQAEGSTLSQRAGYWVSFAFTRYSPLVTPPNRYMPSILVLVVAVSSSWPATT